MPTLTTEWQRLSSANFYSNHYTIAVEGRYTSQSTANNTTNAEFRIVNYADSGYTWRSTSGTVNFTGTYTDSGSSATYPTYVTNGYVLLSISKTISHNADGTKSISLGGHLDAILGGTKYNSNPAQVTVTMPKIDRYPMIVTADNFNDESNPIVTYTTVLGFEGATVEIGITSTDNNTIYVPYREVNVLNGSYTFELTTTERNALRNATPNSNTTNVKFRLITTTTNNVKYYSDSIKTLTIVNANPTYTYTPQETNAKIVALRGDGAEVVYQNASKVKFAVVPTALKGSNIVSVSVTNGDVTESDTTSPYEITVPVTVNAFKIRVVDSRGNYTEDTILITMIDYLNVDIKEFSFERESVTSSNIILNVNATYVQMDIGLYENTPTIKWKLDDGQYNIVPSTSYVWDLQNDRIKLFDYEMTNALSYQNSGTFTLVVEDLLTEDSDTNNINKGIPTYDAGEFDLKVNGDLFVADTDGGNAVNVLDAINGIVESGSNTNGSYTKFANGFMICMVNDLSIPHLGSTNFGTDTVHYGTTNWTYPVAFTTLITCIATAQDVGAGVFGAEIDGGVSTTTAPITCYGGNVSTYKANVIALGTWK